MKIFLNGGGAGLQTTEVNKKLSEIIDYTKPLLYVPIAMKSEEYDNCLNWITNELKNVNISNIDMVRSARELFNKNFDEYSAIFIGGGNTFKLLFELKLTGCFQKIREYIENDGIVFGGSAGAIILGEDIESCNCDDENEVGLIDTRGFDVLNGISLLCHFTNRDEEKNKYNTEFCLNLSHKRKIIALPEEDTIFINGEDIEVIGTEPYFIFDKGNMIKVDIAKSI